MFKLVDVTKIFGPKKIVHDSVHLFIFYRIMTCHNKVRAYIKDVFKP